MSIRVSTFVGCRKVPAVVLLESVPLVAMVSTTRLCIAESTASRKLPLGTGGRALAPRPQPGQSKTASSEARLKTFAARIRVGLMAVM